MKLVCKLMAVVVLLVSVSAIAATSYDGTYKFQSRTKDGQPDMSGWNGTMTIKGNEMNRTYKAPDGKQEKFYTSTMNQSGDTVTLKHTKAYKPEYVGNEHKNTFSTAGNTLTIKSTDGKFVESWIKQ